MIVFNGISNLFNVWLLSFLANPQSVGLLPALMPWAIVIFLQKKYGKDFLIGE
jgi:hypothetical protein